MNLINVKLCIILEQSLRITPEIFSSQEHKQLSYWRWKNTGLCTFYPQKQSQVSEKHCQVQRKLKQEEVTERQGW